MIIKTVVFITILLVSLLPAAELKMQGAQYGIGKHLYRSWNDIEKDVAGLVTSEISKNEFTYRVTTAAKSRLVISRDSIQKPGKPEDLFEFNKNFGTVSLNHVEDAWLVDVFADEHQISFLMSVSTGYLYIKIADDLNQYRKNGLILPASGVGKGKWNVVQCTSAPTTFGVMFAAFAHGEKIKQIELNSHYGVHVQFVGEAKVGRFDLSGDFIIKDDAKLESEKLKNPSVMSAAEFFEILLTYNEPGEKELLNRWLNARQGGKKQVIEQINRFSDDPRSKRALALIETFFSSE